MAKEPHVWNDLTTVLDEYIEDLELNLPEREQAAERLEFARDVRERYLREFGIGPEDSVPTADDPPRGFTGTAVPHGEYEEVPDDER